MFSMVETRLAASEDGARPVSTRVHKLLFQRPVRPPLISLALTARLEAAALYNGLSRLAAALFSCDPPRRVGAKTAASAFVQINGETRFRPLYNTGDKAL